LEQQANILVRRGTVALIVKAADILDNMRYYRLSAESERLH